MAVAGAALLVGVFALADRDELVTQRLELHAPKRCGAIYDTAFARGDITVRVPKGDPEPLVFKQRGYHWGCHVAATEILTPAGPGRYHYSYDEEILWCRGDASDGVVITTPRTGYVVVVDEK